MQKQRFEQRYLITEATAQRVRKLVGHHLSPDEFAKDASTLSYPVRNLHLDANSPETCWENPDAEKNRCYLFLRRYGDDSDLPVFLEIKRKMSGCFLKQRTCVLPSAMPVLFAGSPLGLEHLHSPDADQMIRVERFRSLMSQMATPSRVQINFEREAYVSSDDEVRVTMDRNACWEPNESPRFKARMIDPVCSPKGIVILKLKFSTRFPDWLREVAESAKRHSTDGDAGTE